MATQTQRVYKDDYKIKIYKGDAKALDVGVYENFYKTEEKNLDDYTCMLKTDLFEITGMTYDTNFIRFDLTNTQTNIKQGLHYYEIYMVDSTGKRETILQDIIEIISII